tara:strand:- start:1047 stop:1364 length:318 start_codon:yes stop_codon:yes gene_type:complete
MKRKYFPNNWRAIKDTPDKFFTSMPYEVFEDWKIYGYVLPDSVFALIRTQDEQGKVEEFFYNTERHTRNRLKKAMTSNKQVYVCTMDGMYHLKPNDLPIDFNNEN